MTGDVIEAEKKDLATHVEMDKQRFRDVWKAIEQLRKFGWTILGATALLVGSKVADKLF